MLVPVTQHSDLIFICISKSIPFSLHPSQHLLFVVFLVIAILTDVVLTAFPCWLMKLSTFSWICWPSICFLEKYLQSPYSFLMDFLFFAVCKNSLHILCASPSSDTWFVSVFSHSTGCSFIFVDGFLCCTETC